jgi:catechol 2,3-dioxygenase-like lactoylglutathione lyase family enzyme
LISAQLCCTVQFNVGRLLAVAVAAAAQADALANETRTAHLSAEEPGNRERGLNETKTRITRVETVALPVTNQDRALEFYLGKLGFEKRRDVPFGPGARWIEVAPPGAATTIALVPAGMPTGVRLVTEDAEADHASLRARGVDADPEITRMDPAPPMFSFRDPDGNSLVIGQSA